MDLNIQQLEPSRIFFRVLFSCTAQFQTIAERRSSLVLASSPRDRRFKITQSFGIYDFGRFTLVGLNGEFLAWLFDSGRLSIFLLKANNGDLGKAFFELGGTQLTRHAMHNVFRDVAIAAVVALHADFRRHVEKDSVRFIAEVMGQLDPAATLVGERLVASR